MDLDKLSYRAYGNLVCGIILFLVVLFTLFPFDFGDVSLRDYAIRFVIYFLMLPIYLISREKYDNPIHAVGLNKCFGFTISFYVMLYVLIYLMIKYINYEIAFLISSIFTCLATYFTSKTTNNQEEIGKLFFGFKNNGEPSKYQDIVDFIKYHPLDDSIYEFEQKLKRQDDVLYLVYKYRFIDNLTFKEIGERLDLSNPRITEMLDKVAFAMRINCKI